MLTPFQCSLTLTIGESCMVSMQSCNQGCSQDGAIACMAPSIMLICPNYASCKCNVHSWTFVIGGEAGILNGQSGEDHFNLTMCCSHWGSVAVLSETSQGTKPTGTGDGKYTQKTHYGQRSRRPQQKMLNEPEAYTYLLSQTAPYLYENKATWMAIKTIFPNRSNLLWSWFQHAKQN